MVIALTEQKYEPPGFFQEKGQIIANVRFLKITHNGLKQSILNLEYGKQLF